MRVFEVTGRAVRREKFNVVWRCGAPWPTVDKTNGVSSVTHQLRLYHKASDPNLDELVCKEEVIDDETGLPRLLKDRDGKVTAKVMTRIKQDPGTGAPIRRKLTWCVRADGSRVVECYSDAFELAKNDNLIDILDVREIDASEVVSIEGAEPGSSYEEIERSARPKRAVAKGAQAQAVR